MSKDSLELLSDLIDPTETRVEQLPNFILVFGGPLGHPHDSARQLFLNWIQVKRNDLAIWIRNPEDFPDWNNLDGYANLIDFEKDALCLTKAVVLFSESPGSHAELGAFCMDASLSDRLLVVISNKHYNAGSFIAKGPVKKIEDLHEDSICTVETIKSPEIQHEIPQIVAALDNKLKSLPKTTSFDATRRRDQFLLVADLIDLFGALTVTELIDLCSAFNFHASTTQIKAIFGQLARFGIITPVRRYSVIYYVPTKLRSSYLNYKGKSDAASFHRLRFKTREAANWLVSDSKRYSAYRSVHGDGA